MFVFCESCVVRAGGGPVECASGTERDPVQQ
jgi:hypothetical protein